MSTSLRSHRRPVGRGALGLAASLAVIATFLVPIVINPTAALADTSTGIGSGVECANDNWQAETAADDAGHVYVFYTNYCSNHDFLWFQVSNDGGQTFGAAQTLCSALGAACTVPQANTHTIGGAGYKTEDDPGVFVDTSVSPPKLYVVWDATQSFNTFTPDSVLGAVSSDFGATFTMLNGGANIGGTNCGAGGSVPDCGFPQITAKGSNVTVSSGSYATGSSKKNQLKIVTYSSNGGTSFASTATNGTTATNGNWYYALRSVLDSSGNTWTLWFDLDGTAGTGNYVRYELSKTTSGSSTTSWVTSFYTAPDGPTFPGQSMAATSGYPADWWGGAADLAIDGTNHLYVVFQDGRGHTTDGNPSILRAGTCALASGTCTALGAAAGQWTPQASAPRVDDKDAGSACGGTEALSTAKCSLSFPRLTSTSSGTLALTWVDDRNATVAGCSPNPRFSHTCGLNMWVRTSTTGINGFTTPSVLLSDHAAFSPVWDSDNAGFKFFYGGSSGVTTNPACTNQPFAAWTESVDYNGGSTNGGRVYVKNTQSGPASPTSLTAVPSGSTINLSWPASTGGGVTGYKVYRGSGSNGDNLTLLATLGNVTSYANTGLTTGQTFTYAVSAIGGSEGCQSVRASATAGATVRTLNLATSPGAVGCSNITTTPAPTSGNGTCTRTYADGTVVTVSATTPVAIDANSRYRFSTWSGDATGSGSPTVTMSADRNVTANYVKQWAVTIEATGLTCDAPIQFFCDTGNNTVATVNSTTYIGSDLAYGGLGFPTKTYVDDGGTLTYSYASTVGVPGSTDTPQTLAADANKQYRLDAVSGQASGSTVSSAITINATYVTQRKVTFSQSGIGGDSTGTVVQVTGTGTNPANASLGAGSLGSAAFYDDGSTWAFQSPVASSTTGKRYTASANSGTLAAADEGTTKSSTYTTQWLLTLATNPGGIGAGHITPNPTSASGYYNSGTSVQLTADAAVTSGGAPYTFQNWTGDVATPPNSTNPISVSMTQARNVTANYSLDSFGVSITKNGTGSGSVTSSPAGITCGATCSNSFTYGTLVTLTATPATGSDFTGWSGAGCTGTGTCQVTVDAAKSVTATFTFQTDTLTVSKNGTGSGGVTSSPVGINCGATCSTGFDYGTVVTLTANPAASSDFTGWSGEGCTGTGTCQVTLDQARSVTATFTLKTETLNVSENGTGTGSVGSSPVGITCGATCSAGFAYGTVVTLTATPSVSSTFAGWAGEGCVGTGTCQVTLDQARSVTATFTLKTPTLTVSKTGTGSGSVSSSPAGITCGVTCSHDFNYGTVVTLTANAAASSDFTGWSGEGCTGTGTCQVTLDQARSVTAAFTLKTENLTVPKTGTGSGSVSSSPSGITCGVTCSAGFDYGTAVTLTATPATGSSFTGWSGEGCTGTGTCQVTLDQARSVTATFTLQTRTLDVTLGGVGSGSVGSSPAGITCGVTCSAGFDYGTVITLTSTPGFGSVFTGWTGSGCSGTGDCVVTMDAAHSVTANFSNQPQQALDVAKNGTGTGSVTSSPAGIDCGPTCSITFDFNTDVTLTASPDANSTFTGWSGSGCSGTGDCVVTMNAAHSVTATFTVKPPKALDVTTDGTGTGTVTSSPAGIDCGVTCTHAFAHGTVVTLTATPDASSDFTGWSGAGCTGTGDCQVTMDQARSVTATFTLKTESLTVSKAGTGSGSVSSTPAGITCGGVCAHGFDYGTSVTLTATPAASSDFTGWTGAGCSGTGDCVVTMDQARSVTATFALKTETLNVSTDGTGTGSASSSPTGIDCGATCSSGFDYGTSVTLTATPDTGSDFTGWTGAGCSGTGTCQVTMDQARSVTATFTLQTRNLNVSTDGTGTGSLSSSPAGIDCGATCSAGFDYGTSVTLTATADLGSDFTGWSGAGCTGTGDCVVTMDAAHSVTATFDVKPNKTLDVSADGTGSGSVGSSPAGIDCGATCTQDFAFGTSVTLTATPAASSDFTGWTGAGCSGTGTCSVTMDAVHSVTATFTLKTESLDVSLNGTGTGSVSSSPAGMDCGTTCAAGFDYGTSVTLTATPDVGSMFVGWTGDCTGVSGCVVTMDQARSVTATFTSVAHQPDGRIGTSSKVAKMVGDNVYNATGKSQSKSGKAKHNKTKTFYVSVQNDGDATDTIALKGSKSAKGFTVKYYAGKKDVTKQVVRGTYQFQNLAAGGTAASIKVVVKVNSTAKIGAVQKLTITASSGVSAMDVVKAKVKAVR